MRGYVNWAKPMKKSSRFARIAHQVAKSIWWSITAKIVGLKAAQGKTNGVPCDTKGYYGWDFINDTQILTPRAKTPMIRRQRGGKLGVSQDEALNYVAERLSAIKAVRSGCNQTTGSSRGTGNETNYVMQKFARAVIGTNNVDCYARV
ncbi:molybdopterin-dependent oxidoreductase [Salmonella enterica subsp. enterica serovar Weltevreden]|nr:molybdopterin-dependent oxidoreductase [Salmonella enterica subsp. enterica serovar Weltevreden]